MKLFRTAGDFGDVIYAMSVMRHLGGGTLLFEATRYTREPMTPRRWITIAPLLHTQPCVHGSRPWRGEQADVNLNDFRAMAFHAKWEPKERSILDWMLMQHGLPLSVKDEAWLTVRPAVPGCRVVFNRSLRYHNPRFPWKAVVVKYPQAVFVGLPNEHRQFCAMFGEVPHLQTADLLEAASIIAGADLFIGNQSACYAIAEGLKKPAVLEVYTPMPNCLFHRPGVVHGWDEGVQLPDLC